MRVMRTFRPTPRPIQQAPRQPMKRKAPRNDKPRSPINPFSTECWLRRFDPGHECVGPVVRCHLIKEQWLRDRLGLDAEDRWHSDWWIPGCDGRRSMGLLGHHQRFDGGEFKLERRDLPTRIERRAQENELVAYKLEQLYGPLPVIGRVAA